MIWSKLSHRSGILAANMRTGFNQYQFQEPRGRCLAPKSMEPGADLLVGRCLQDAPEQSFDVHGFNIRLQAHPELCIMLSGDDTTSGRALVLDHCRTGDHSQQIVGMCLAGDSPEGDAKAFAKTCDQAVTAAAESPPPFPRPMGTSLFCFMVEMSNSGEVLLDFVAKSKKAGIYGCDASKVYEGHPVDARHTEESFMRVWQQVFEDGKYKSYDWTVKVDPDTVWLPDRLRSRLEAFETS